MTTLIRPVCMISCGSISPFQHVDHFKTLAQIIESLQEQWSTSQHIQLLTFESLSNSQNLQARGLSSVKRDCLSKLYCNVTEPNELDYFAVVAMKWT